MKNIIPRVRVQNIPVIKLVIYHLGNSLGHTAHLGGSLHDCTDAETVIPYHQLHVVL